MFNAPLLTTVVAGDSPPAIATPVTVVVVGSVTFPFVAPGVVVFPVLLAALLLPAAKAACPTIKWAPPIGDPTTAFAPPGTAEAKFAGACTGDMNCGAGVGEPMILELVAPIDAALMTGVAIEPFC